MCIRDRHRPVGNFTYPFLSHALVHHHIFKSDHTYHVLNPADKKIIPMEWRHGPALVIVGMIPVLIATLPFGRWDIALGALIAFGSYYGAYEYMHWCMHLPKARRVERSWAVSYTHLRAHETRHDLVCRLL